MWVLLVGFPLVAFTKGDPDPADSCAHFWVSEVSGQRDRRSSVIAHILRLYRVYTSFRIKA